MPFLISVCSLIEKLSLSKMPFKSDPVIGESVCLNTHEILEHVCDFVFLRFSWLAGAYWRHHQNASSGLQRCQGWHPGNSCRSGNMRSLARSVSNIWTLTVAMTVCYHSHHLMWVCLIQIHGCLFFFFLCLQAAVLCALSALCEEYYQAQPDQADSEKQSEFFLLN